jgi:hypothetical protein
VSITIYPVLYSGLLDSPLLDECGAKLMSLDQEQSPTGLALPTATALQPAASAGSALMTLPQDVTATSKSSAVGKPCYAATWLSLLPQLLPGMGPNTSLVLPAP